MILIINTAKEEAMDVILANGQTDFTVKSVEGKYQQAEQLLPTIEELIKQAGREISQLTGVAVVNGPGGFTSLRIGVVTANVLAYALKIPVVGLMQDEFKSNDELVEKSLAKLAKAKVGEIVMPEYGREPNIS